MAGIFLQHLKNIIALFSVDTPTISLTVAAFKILFIFGFQQVYSNMGRLVVFESILFVIHCLS